MNVPHQLRRPFVVLGVVLSLLLGVATIRAAASWTAASSPLAAKPPSVEALQTTLAEEQSRSAALRAQLEDLTAGSTELTAALDAARSRIAADADQARALQARLKAAKARLASLEASVRRATAATAGIGMTPTVAAAAAPSVQAGEHEEDDDG
jgi:septal ring factor EnvC (AmiA/AmiB activator)